MKSQSRGALTQRVCKRRSPEPRIHYLQVQIRNEAFIVTRDKIVEEALVKAIDGCQVTKIQIFSLQKAKTG